MKNVGLFVTANWRPVRVWKTYVWSKDSFFSICFETDLFVSVLSVVSIWIRNTETNGTENFCLVSRNKPKINGNRWALVCFGSNRKYIFVCFVENLVFMLLLCFFSVCFKTSLYVSVVLVVSKRVKNTETNRNWPKKTFFSFAKQTENQPKQILFRFVSVRTENFFCLFRKHPKLKHRGTVHIEEWFTFPLFRVDSIP
jgi:hypothetical protein